MVDRSAIAVLVTGPEAPTLRLKLAYVGWEEDVLRVFGRTPRLTVETIAAAHGEEDGIREALRRAARAALASSRVGAYVAGIRG